jgi:hypothetical protein
MIIPPTNFEKNKLLNCDVCINELSNYYNSNSMNNSEVIDYVAYYFGLECCYQWIQINKITKYKDILT